MKLVIDIDESYYDIVESYYDVIKGLKKLYDHGATSDKAEMLIIIDAIANGTPLPKGHGGLCDKDALIKYVYSNYGIGTDRAIESAGMEDIIAKIYNAPIIIEADKAESEE